VLSRGYKATLALYALFDFIYDPTKYADVKRWYASRFEFAGLNHIQAFIAVERILPVSEFTAMISSPGNARGLAKLQLSFLAYACTAEDIYHIIEKQIKNLGGGDLKFQEADALGGRFARFGNQYMPWCSFYGDTVFAAVIHGPTTTTPILVVSGREDQVYPGHASRSRSSVFTVALIDPLHSPCWACQCSIYYLPNNLVSYNEPCTIGRRTSEWEWALYIGPH